MPLHLDVERRRSRSAGFDVAAALELNLNRFPTKTAMLTLLQSWLYAAEKNGLAENRPGYVHALSHAVEVMKEAGEPVQAIALLQMRERAYV